MIDGAELHKRGYRLLHNGGYVLLTSDGCKLTPEQGVSFTTGERATAAELAKRLSSYRPPLSFAKQAQLARRRHRREQRRLRA